MISNKRMTALLLAGLCAAALAGCSKSDDDSEASAETTVSQTAETTAAQTTSAETTTTAAQTTTAPQTTASSASTTVSSGTTASTTPPPQAENVKILWSERGLEAVAADSTEGYGEPLATGSTYLDWTLRSVTGSLGDLTLDFDYAGELQTNGIAEILPSDHAAYPNALYLRVDNQADFPYFPSDTRERGKFIIENSDEAKEMLKVEAGEQSVAVAVNITTLKIHLSPDGYDLVTVTSASRR